MDWAAKAELQTQLASLRAELRDARAELRRSRQNYVDKAAAGIKEIGKGTPANSAAVSKDAGSPADVAALLKLHARWDWDPIAREMLAPFSSITRTMLDSAVRTCFDNGTMYCMRAQVHQGNLYITDYRAVFFDRHYAPARIIPLLEILKRHRLPDLDIVVAAVDEPRVKTRVQSNEWTKLVLRYPGGSGERALLPPPLFSSTVNRAHLDLPWPDFSFFMPRKPHKLRTAPWAKLHPQMIAESDGVQWEEKLELAIHTGNVGSPFRKRLARVAERNPQEMLVNELFIGDHGKITSTCKELGLHARGGYQQHKCYMTFQEQCSYKYLLNSASIGYANKFKYLLLCGSVVIYVQEGMVNKEFYEYGLLPGVHYVTVETAEDVPAMVRYLKQNDEYARAVSQAGRARLAALDVPALTDFFATLLRQYAARQAFPVEPQPGAVRIECEDDLWRHYARDTGFLQHYRMEDNETCIHAIPAGKALGPPGWGGAYAGSKPRCEASHDQRSFAQPEICKKMISGESFEPWTAFPRPHPRDAVRWTAL